MRELRKLTVPLVLPLVQALYARHSAGCCLHLVLDDGNVQDDFVRSCAEFAILAGHEDCKLLAHALFTMSKTQRLKLARHGAKHVRRHVLD